MKLQKSVLACALFLLLGAVSLAAAPETADPAAKMPAAATVEIPFTAVVAALGEAATDCVAKPSTRSSLDPYVCGNCSQNPCKGAFVNDYCGFSGGKPKVCQDYLASTCGDESGQICRCSNAPIP